ncbi:uncharacterized protein LOC110725985 [Chenopodium quinoa]|uniref:uncharacterized protein LOC110725985 n=1 Tax=Chenopodium quinoa TaxID=63459 RepID=UPI000B772C73|nr:uncharacterized protein LOC110725985 [Chenopodium quinoa]
MEVLADEVFPDGEQRDWEESGSEEEAPSTSGSSGVREVDGEGAASSNEAGDAEAGQGSRAESSDSDQDNFAADYQQPPKVADNPNPKRTRMLSDEALRMVDQAKTPAKSAALLRKEAALAKKVAVEAKDSKKGGESVKKIPRSFSKLLKRQGDDLEKTPAAKAARKDPPPPQKQTSAQSSRPTTGVKSPVVLRKLSKSSERSQQKAPDASTASKGGDPPNVASGAATPGEEQKPETHLEAQGKGRIEIPWPLDFMRIKTKVDPSKGSVSSRQKMNVDYAASISQSTTFDADLTSDEPNLASFAKRMVMLRVDGLRGPFRRKQEEEEMIRSLTAANDEANSRADDLDKQLKDAKSDLKALEDADKENAQLRADVNRLGVELVNLRNKQSDELAQEQKPLTEENERDNLARLKITWSLLYPEIDFEVYKLRYDYASEVYDAQLLGDAPPPRFKDWAAEQGYDVSDTEEPPDGHNEGQTSQTQPEQPP